MTELTNLTFASFTAGGIIQLMDGGMIFPKDKEIAAIVQLVMVKLYQQDQLIDKKNKYIETLNKEKAKLKVDNSDKVDELMDTIVCLSKEVKDLEYQFDDLNGVAD